MVDGGLRWRNSTEEGWTRWTSATRTRRRRRRGAAATLVAAKGGRSNGRDGGGWGHDAGAVESSGEASGKRENEEEDVGMNYIGAERSGTAGSGSISPELVGEVGGGERERRDSNLNPGHLVTWARAGVGAWARRRRGVREGGAGKAEKVGGTRAVRRSPARGAAGGWGRGCVMP
ncbi:hypothetical protein [Oryza sativa Japonica Group]|uniref:Uncharacterized protein n=1 Tax=Oryza sativa subsp. japonica TaxID=39947 RepID=Q656U7_ORYSJ|nr:hypothetical protein [Oryza sativa Japonica Group]BAD45171.1 hypothetical protein [Oryza sativa Japonica Group]